LSPVLEPNIVSVRTEEEGTLFQEP